MLSKKLSVTEGELAAKLDLVSDYEQRFLQVRDVVESEKTSHELKLKDLADQLDTKEQAVNRVEERLKQMTEERAQLLSK